MFIILFFFGREVGLSEFYIVIIMFSFVFIFVFGISFWSWVVKKWGYRCILMVGLVGYSVGILVFVGMWFLGFFGVLLGLVLFIVLLVSCSL